MNKFEKSLLEQYGEDDLKKIQAAKVGIAGAGGLGSNCAFNLVRSGFKDIRIIDFDIIDHSNLNRQFYFADQVGKDKVEALKENLLRITPDLDIDARVERIEKENIAGLFEDREIVVEAFDKAEYKSMLVETFLVTNKLIVSASGLVGIGRSDEIKVNRLKKNLIVIGDMTSDSKDTPPVSPRVNIAAAKQADVVLEYVVGKS
ncbi:MAG: sulfur carrier protein ThiS adenylyltransferase ThiF [Candidatus Tantalella remota]|nr:sulfur carrier protein ThiS adenylyltransferase ThiF [Candidatus Tantalella remota]